MKIKLIRTGGFIPLIKVAEMEVNLTDQELENLREIIKSSPSAPRVKDGTYYELVAGNVTTPVDLDKVPDDFKPVFEKLKGDLKIVKRG